MSADSRRRNRPHGLRSLNFMVFLVVTGTILLAQSIVLPVQRWTVQMFGTDTIKWQELDDVEAQLTRLTENSQAMLSDPEFRLWLKAISEVYLSIHKGIIVRTVDGNLAYSSPGVSQAAIRDAELNYRFRFNLEGEYAGTVFTTKRPLIGENEQVHGYFLILDFIKDYFPAVPEDETETTLDLPEDSPIYAMLLSGQDLLTKRAARQKRLSLYARFAIAAAIATAIGLLSTILLTRRLTRLARQAEVSDEHGVPGPFLEDGPSEIAILGGTLNQMRERIRGLIRGLESRDHARSEWVAQVSHDIRTPLTALRICLDRAEDEAGSDSAIKETLHLAQHDVRRLQKLTEDLLEAAHLETNAELSMEPVLPWEVLRTAIRSVQSIADENNISIMMDVDQALKPCEADGERLLRACENLLRNALRHARETVTAGAREIEGGVEFWIQDDGMGFPGATGPIQLTDIRRKASGGEGASLGLLVVERVAEAHHGEVILCNMPGGGAEARLRILSQPDAS